MDEAIVTRIMPNDRVAEDSVVGAMIMDNEAYIAASEILTKEDFYYQQCGVLYEAIAELNKEGKAIDPVILQAKLKEMGMPESFASVEYISQLVSAVPYSVNVSEYAKIVKDKSMLRKIIRTNQKIEELCFKQTEPLPDILNTTEQDFLSILQQQGVSEVMPINEVVREVLDEIQKASMQRGNITGIPTGFIDLDYKLSGLQDSDLILLAARPSMGKTALVLNIAQHVAFHEGLCTAIFSLEMSNKQLVKRLMALESTVEAQNLRNGTLQERDWDNLIEGAGIISDSKLIIDDTPGISVSALRSKCRRYKQEHDLKLVLIDYLQLMSGSGKTESRQQEISDISRSLKSLARELNVPVIALSQLNRGVEQRDDKRPMLSDLRDSGAIEQDADVVMFIYRDDYYNKDSEDKGISEIIIAKQRNGPVGNVKLAWLPQYTKFANYAGNKKEKPEE